MTKLSTLSIVFFTALSSASLATNYSTGQCQAWFRSVDRNQDGSLSSKENASMFLSRITLANDNDRDYIMTQSFFVAECKIGSLGKPPV
jgi:hypothetical protein